jgi:hypothetical protein
MQQCPRCDVTLELGFAIQPNIESGALTILPVAPIQSQDLTLIPVLKCPMCGHSEDIT